MRAPRVFFERRGSCVIALVVIVLFFLPVSIVGHGVIIFTIRGAGAWCFGRPGFAQFAPGPDLGTEVVSARGESFFVSEPAWVL